MSKGESRKTKRNQAARARAREAHVKMVLERQGDPSLAQQTFTPTGRIVTFGSDVNAEIAGGMQALRLEFAAKFGREPTDEDPLFFDPDKDEPTPLDDDALGRVMGGVYEAMARTGVDPAFIAATKETGIIPTEANEHLMTVHDMEAFEDAYDRAQRRLDAQRPE